ncbi:hypothetical protein OG324_49965 [Streptomyces sp. NBC_01236]|nr:hypothetical protein OG324_49965 [Streptomyces sp. NBC_01236]
MNWRLDDGELTVDVHVPDGTSAQIDLPGRPPFRTGPGQHTYHIR